MLVKVQGRELHRPSRHVAAGKIEAGALNVLDNANGREMSAPSTRASVDLRDGTVTSRRVGTQLNQVKREIGSPSSTIRASSCFSC